ncbi:hypothetical protein [Pseudomonas sp. FME51]|nr:hypothetical protein [Pseudomonas sp. FME51]
MNSAANGMSLVWEIQEVMLAWCRQWLAHRRRAGHTCLYFSHHLAAC